METGNQDTRAKGPSPASRRVPEIDWLKGFAIIAVLLIHANPLGGTALHEYLINRAVPIFVVLFGATSELWWQAHAGERWVDALGPWYRGRLWRLMVPVWGMLLVWWTLSIVFDPRTPLSPGAVIATVLGYLPWVGTGWFVTLILQLVLLFPVIRICVVRFGGLVCLLTAAAVFVVSHYFMFEIITLMRVILLDTPPKAGFYALYSFWIFPPWRVMAVVAGVMIARRRRKLNTRDGVLAALVFVAGILIHMNVPEEPRLRSGLMSALDIPLTVLLLVVISGVRAWRPATSFLAWCGNASWGLYLGQMIVHNSANMFHFTPWTSSTPMRWAYFACLFVGAVGFVTIGTGIRETSRSDWIPRLRNGAAN